ncbi:hypothetical protein ACFO9Q_03730 [Paenibacillus sp. GCM10023252]|uniref:hypothetical protein n=1 Tax=Paenibacillus sp. GCM10023252 TaxID=3252649 RepID=UPI00361E29C8
MIVAFIIGCEIGFWVFVLGGLVCRYVFGWRKVGALLLLCTPLVDLLLAAATVLDLRRGAVASWEHALSAIYIGVSVAYGHRMVKWADAKFAHRFAGGPALPPRVKHGAEHAREERRGWLRHLLAWAVGCLVLVGMIVMVGDESRTESLLQTIGIWSLVLGADFLISFSYTLWPKKAKCSAAVEE